MNPMKGLANEEEDGNMTQKLIVNPISIQE
jgi:hypothetical protein